MSSVTLEKRIEAKKRPSGIPIMHQGWRQLLFLHWKVDPDQIQATLPPGLTVDTFQGKGYVTLNIFFMENVSFTGIPAVPGLSNFTEVNFRTYVYDKQGNPGIWFYSLDIDSLVATTLARNAFSLPYFFSDLKASQEKNKIHVEGRRSQEEQIHVKAIFEPTSDIYQEAKPNTLDFFLIERYILFSFAANQLNKAHVHHLAYPLGEVEVSELKTNLIEAQGFKLENLKPDRSHYSTGVDVDIFNLIKV